MTVDTTVAKNTDYENIDRPYNSFLERSIYDTFTLSEDSSPDSSTTTGSTSGQTANSNSNGTVETQPAKSDGSIGDVWIRNFIRSENWIPRTQGFAIDGQTGYAEFSNVYVSGHIRARSGLIGGFSILSSELFASSNGNQTILSSGNIAFMAGPINNPNITISQSGILTATGAVISGSFSASTIDIGGSDTTSFHVDINGNMWLGAATYDIATNPFAVSSTGQLRAVSGNVGGFTLSDIDFSVSNGVNTTILSSDDISFAAGPTGNPNVTIDVTGVLTARNAVISGSIAASAGTIAGFTIELDHLYAGTGATRIQLDTLTGIHLGATTFALAPFRVSTDGALTASNANITGVINALSGVIGGFTLDSNALYAGLDNTRIQLDVTTGIHLGATNYASAPFKVSLDGNLIATNADITGTINASSGVIGGFSIGPTSLYAGANNSRIELDTNNGIWLGHNSFDMAPFSVSPAGFLKATNTEITGTFHATNIDAQSGTIGGFTITPTELYGGVIKTGATVGLGSNGIILDADGLRGYDAVLGNVFNLPTDGSAPSFSSGIIRSTVFEVGTNAIIRTSETVGDGGDNSAGILINDTGLYGLGPNQTPSNANVRILVDGSAFFNVSIRGGQTDFNTGTGYFIGQSGGDYKFSLGDPSANYLTWDGSYLKMQGSFNVGSGGLINNGIYTVANLPISPTSVGFNSASDFE